MVISYVLLKSFVLYEVLAFPSLTDCCQKYLWSDNEEATIGHLFLSPHPPPAGTDSQTHTYIECFNLEKGQH